MQKEELEFGRKTQKHLQEILEKIESMQEDEILPMIYANMIAARMIGCNIDSMAQESRDAVNRLKPILEETMKNL